MNKKVNLVALIYIVHLLFSYYYFPWFFSAFTGFILILALSYFAWSKQFTFWLGIPPRARDYLYTGVLLIAFLGVSYFMIHRLGRQNGIAFHPGNFKNLFHTFFYTLNEEIVLGSILLKGIRYYRNKTPEWIISVGVAFLFSVIHFIFFKWIFKDSGSLGLVTLLSLFAVGVFRNNLILRTGHIGFSWAIHFVWIYIMLGSSHYNTAEKFFLNDFERFELYLGDIRVLMACLIIAAISFMKFSKTTFSE